MAEALPKPSRSLSIDLIKSLAIFGVVYIHGGAMLAGPSVATEFLSGMFRAGVPAFIIIWAFFVEKALLKGRPAVPYLAKSLFHLFVVFVFWSALYYFLHLRTAPPESLVSTITRYWLGYGWSGQYFFIILFQLVVLFPVIRICYEIVPLRIAVIAATVVLYLVWEFKFSSLPSICAKFEDRPFPFWVIHVFGGIALARASNPGIPRIFVLAPLLIPFEYMFLERFGFKHDPFHTIPYFTLGVALGSLLFCAALIPGMEVRNAQLRSAISFIGANTMTVFVANPLVIALLSPVVPTFSGVNLVASVALALLSAIIIMLPCLLLAVLINRTPLRGYVN